MVVGRGRRGVWGVVVGMGGMCKFVYPAKD